MKRSLLIMCICKAVWVTTCLWVEPIFAQQDHQPDAEVPVIGDAMFNLKTPTLGGKQLWTDHAWRRGWRIQHNAVFGHWRLLDDKNVRYAWGDRQQCEVELNKQVPDHSLTSQEAVVLLHGLGRSSSSMRRLGDHLQAELELLPIYFEYASTRCSVSDHAVALGDFIDSLPTELRLNFVGHSMGNIVVRHYVGDMQRVGRGAELDRIKTMVMLAPPNQGASIARQLAKTGVFGWIAGKGGLELGPDWREFQSRLATPPFPFGIISGKVPEAVPNNPLVDGEGDFVVSVDETHLEGAADTLTVPHMHSFLMDTAEVQEAAVHFIKSRRSFSQE